MDDEPNMTFVMFTWSEWVLFTPTQQLFSYIMMKEVNFQ